MKKLIKAQCNVLLRKKGAIICFLLLTASAGGNFIFNVIKYWHTEYAEMPSFLEISLLAQENMVGWYIVMFFPFLLVLPGGMSLASDRKEKMDILWVGRCGRKQYLLSRTAAVIIVTFLCFFIPLMLELVLNLTAFPINAHGNAGGWELYTAGYEENVKQYLLFSFYYAWPVLYAVIMSMVISLSAAFLAIIPLACSCFFYKYYAYLMVPVYFLFSLFQKTEFPVGKIKLSHNYYFYFQWCHANIYMADLIAFGCIVLAVFLMACAVVLWNIRKDTV